MRSATMGTLLAFVVGAALGERWGRARRGAQLEHWPGGGIRALDSRPRAGAALTPSPGPAKSSSEVVRAGSGVPEGAEVRVGASGRGPGWHRLVAAGAQPGARKRGVSCSRSPAGCNVTPTAAGGGGWDGGGGGARRLGRREGETGRDGDGRKGRETQKNS